ncbi:PEP-CTERM sorting domain-containing protein [Oxalobacteraceae bacterium]|nr:PEP-CTERM sorting domain-containing protein [Oxalobacteraceae bacterium]
MKNNYKALVMGLLIASSGLISQSAHAVTDISKPTQAITVSLSGNFNLGDTFSNNNLGNTFADKFSFLTTGWTNVDMLLTSTSTKATNGLNLTGLGLYNSANVQIAAGVQMLTGVQDKWAIAAPHLTAGNYYFKILGNVVGNTGGSFAANGHVVSTIPEADSYAMLLAGLGLIGFVARRRRHAA